MNTLKLLDERQLAYELFGPEDGKPVIFHHGMGDSRLSRHPDEGLITEAGVRLIIVDRPGYGRSTPRIGNKLLDWVPDIAQLADSLGLEKFTVAGASAGAPYALAVAHELEDRVVKVLLASPLGPLSAPGALKTVHKDFQWLWRLRWFKSIIRMWGRNEAKKAKEDIKKYFDDWLIDAPELDKELFADSELRKMLEQGSSEAFRQGADGMIADLLVQFNWGFELENIHAPVEIFHGSADEILFPEMAQNMVEKLPQAKLTLYQDEGHYCLYRHWLEIFKRAV
ncbi:alpha/beta fold hydrolase [Bacteroidota bacterium]